MRARQQKIRNPAAEAAQFRLRAFVGFALVVLALAGLAAWYFRLQVVQHDDYARQSEANRIKPRPIVPARGLIYDRRGRLLADHVPAYRLEVVPEQVRDVDALLAELGAVVPLSDEERERFLEGYRVKRAFQPVPLKLRLSEAEVASFAVQRYRFPGVDVVPYLNRRYPYGALFAHVVGYVGRIDEADLEKMQDPQDRARYTGATHIGKGGI